MANKKISELESRASLSLSDLMAVGDPSTGYLYKTTISDLKTLTGAGVVSFNGRFGSVNPAEGDYTLTQLGDVIITSPSNGQVLKYNGSNWVNATEAGETDTLDSVTTRGNTTANSITVGSVTAAGLSNLLGQIKTFATTGNTYIGANPTSASDSGYKLDVNGSTRVQTLTVTNSAYSGVLSFEQIANNHSRINGGPQETITFGPDNAIRLNTNLVVINAGSILLPGTNNYYAGSNFTPVAFAPAVGGTKGLIFGGNYTNSGAGGVYGASNIVGGCDIATSIGTITLNQFSVENTINTTGGTTIHRGFYYNPTLTATTGLTHYAFEATSGLVKLATLAGTGSRMVVADANGVLSTQAIADLSGYVTLSTAQTITGAKTFNNLTTFNQNIVGGIIKLSQGVLLSKSAAIGTDPGFLSLIATSATGLNYLNFADGDAPSNFQRFAVPNTGNYTYTFPAASGTVALASDIPSLTNYVTLDGTQTITGLKTFSGLLTANGNIKATYYGFADTNGYSTGFESQSNNTIQVKIGSGLAINIASNNNTTFYGNIIRNGGTSSQFLKADGSLDSSTYLTSASVSGVYLPLSGGTLTGALNGTSATFSGAVNGQSLVIKNSGVPAAQFYRDLDVTVVGSAGQGIEFGARSGSTYIAGAAIYGGLDNPATTGNLVFQTLTGGSLTTKLTINSAGAATFSSSVTATELYLSTSSGFVGNINSSNANGGYLTWQTNGAVIADIGTANQIFGSGGAEMFGINARGSRNLAFGTNNTERARITSGGALLVNTTSDNNTGKLQVSGKITTNDRISTGMSGVANLQEWIVTGLNIPNGGSYDIGNINNQYDMISGDLYAWVDQGAWSAITYKFIIGYNTSVATSASLGPSSALTMSKVGTTYNETIRLTNNSGSNIANGSICIRIWGAGTTANASVGGSDLLASSPLKRVR